MIAQSEVIPNNGQLVRTARAEITALTWVDLFGTPSLNYHQIWKKCSSPQFV